MEPGDQEDLPLCSRLLTQEEVAHCLRLAGLLARLADLSTGPLPPDADSLHREAHKQSRDEASRHRDFRWSVLPGDKVWLTQEPSRHPEVVDGTLYLVVVRAGNVVLKYRLDHWAGLGLVPPVVAPTTRLTRDEVVALASGWVQDRYPAVPAINWVQEFSDRTLDQMEKRLGNEIPQDERRQLSNKWVVCFACSWDTDELGLPTTLQVLIDDATGQVELVAPAA